MPVTAQKESGGEVISTFISAPDAGLLAALRAHAAENERTLAAEIRRALRFYMQKDDDPASTPGRVTTSAGLGRHGTG